MEQLVILVVIALISFINWIIQRSAELREKRKLERKNLGIPDANPYHQSEAPEARPALPPQKPVDPAAEMRKLMEALGIPLEEEPPPPVVHREQPPPLPEPPAPPKPLVIPGPRVAVSPPAVPVPAAPKHSSPLAAALRSQNDLRKAIILREILGPPRALAPQ
jgi:hypothetical protein